MALLAMQAWEPAGHDASLAWYQSLGVIGPWLLFAIMGGLIARAYLRRDRYRALRALGAAEQEAVHEALRDAEKETIGEIVPVVLERSDAHPAANWLSAVTTVLLGTALLAPHLPWDRHAVFLLAQVGLGAAGWFLAHALPDYKRLFVRETRATEVAEEQALQEFFAGDLYETDQRTGVLLFVSLFEHRVIVLADRGINAVVDDDEWRATDAAILKGARTGALSDGLIAGIERAGAVLAAHFPWEEGDRNELPDRLIVRRE